MLEFWVCDRPPKKDDGKRLPCHATPAGESFVPAEYKFVRRQI